jgi:hypothetical protein
MLEDKFLVEFSLADIGQQLALAEGAMIAEKYLFITNPVTNPRTVLGPLSKAFSAFRQRPELSNAGHELQCSSGGCDLYFQKN